MSKIMGRLLPLMAACVLAAGCRESGKPNAMLFPAPFGNVNLGMTESDFRAIWPEATKNQTTEYATWTYWEVAGADGFKEASFGFLLTEGTTGAKLSYAMLSYSSGISFRKVLAEAEKRLGAVPVRTTLFDGALCFQRTWQFGQNETTLLFWPWAKDGTSLQWRISDKPGASSAHDGFLPKLDIPEGAWTGFKTVGNYLDAFDLVYLAETRQLTEVLAGWETFKPFDLEAVALADDDAKGTLRGYWIIGVEPVKIAPLPPWFAIGADASWIANLGTNGVARAIPESRRSAILDILSEREHDLAKMAMTSAPFAHERRAALWTEAWGGMRVDWTAVADWPTGDSPAAKAARTWIEERLRYDRKSFDGNLRNWDAMTRFHGKRFLAKNGQKQIEEEWRGPNGEETEPRTGLPDVDPGVDTFIEKSPLWFSHHSATIEYEDERIVSYRAGFYGFHVGNSTSAAYVKCATFRKSDGEILGWDSFTDTNAVFQLIREQAEKKFGKNADIYGNGIPVPDEPLFTKDGFWVFWGDYSIDTPHAYEEGGKFPSLFIRWKTADGSAEILRIDVDEAFRRKL